MSDALDAGDHRTPPPTTASFSALSLGPLLLLLPSELLQEILLRLALPELLRLRSVSRPLSLLISSPDFRRLYHFSSASASSGASAAAWLLLFKKLPPRDAALRGFHGPSGRWFRIPLAAIVAPAVPPGEDLYFLAASGSVFLFASNGRRELVAIDLAARAARRVPPSPLGPRGTSSWRRFGLKLVTEPPGSDRFRFLFAEVVNNSPLLFEYRSDADTWQSSQAVLADVSSLQAGPSSTYLCATHTGPESVVVCSGPALDHPVFFRPRFPDNPNPAQGDRLHVYGDGNAVVVRSTVIDEPGRTRVKIVTGVDLFGLGSVGSDWHLVSSVPNDLIEGFKKPYGAMTGLLAEREGMIRLVLMSNCKGVWDLVWLSYDRVRGEWRWVPVPDWGTKGLNMAGIAISSTFSRLWPLSSCHNL